MASKAAALYEDDFYAWTREQAAALRTHFRGDNRLDVEHLAEEIEDLGRSELRGVQSHIEQIIAHLLKLGFSGLSEPREHWRREIGAFRLSLEERLTPSLRRRAEASLPRLYARACRSAAHRLAPYEPDFDERLPRICPYTFHDITRIDPPFYPEPMEPGAGRKP